MGRRGITANLLQLEPGAADRIDGTVRFFCGPQAAYVTGQTVHVGVLVAALRGHGGADVVVHNAGITRDRMLAQMETA